MGIERWKVRELFPVDLSPEALNERFRDLEQLDELVRSFQNARVAQGEALGGRTPVAREPDADWKPGR